MKAARIGHAGTLIDVRRCTDHRLIIVGAIDGGKTRSPYLCDGVMAMMRYHFNVHDGVDIRDREGLELRSLSAARVEAVRSSGRLLTDRAAEFWNNGDWRMEVTDDRGLILFVLQFSAMDSAVLGGGGGITER